MSIETTPAAAARDSAPRILTELPGPRARALIERDEAVASPSLTRAYPLVAESASGLTVTDVDGNRFLDFAAGIAVTSTGHAHPSVVAAIKEQADRLIHIAATDFYEPRYLEFMERLASHRPVRRAGARLPHQLGHRGGRGGHQAGALPHPSARDHRLRGRVPRSHAGRAVADQLARSSSAPASARCCRWSTTPRSRGSAPGARDPAATAAPSSSSCAPASWAGSSRRPTWRPS